MNTIEETIKAAPFLKEKIWRKQIELVKTRIVDTGEELLAVAFEKSGKQHLYVTNKSIYFNEIKGVFSNIEQIIPLSNVSSVACSPKGVWASLTVVTSGATIAVEDISVAIAQEVMKVIESLRTQLSTDSAKDNVIKYDTFDLVDEIRELKDLLDEGLITQDEFDAKKKQLLGV